MIIRPALLALALAVSGTAAEARPAAATPAAAPAKAEGIVRLRSNHGFDETVERLKAAIAAKGVRFFDAIDQQALGKEANLTIGKSVVVRFGNPPLGVQFLQANRYAGLDWPVRMLVVEEADGSIWLAWTDFAWMAKRYGITTQDAQFKMAAEVAGSIAADAAK
ncbi:MAG: chromosome condensation protein CrcB [Sphingobium sp.]|nr:chromosome condensation protein CrcB [Sphingobium sp.]